MGACRLVLTFAFLACAAAASESACALVEQSGQDQLSPAEAEACFAECRASWASSPLWVTLPLALPLVLVDLFFLLIFLCWSAGERKLVLAFLLLFTGLYVHLVAALVDWTGFALDGHGTSCFKAATGAAFGRVPAWLGPLLGLLLLTHSCHQAFREEVNEERLRGFCSRVPGEEEEELFPGVKVPKARLEKVKVAAKASASLGDVVLDACSLWSFLRQGQPSYVLLTLICILMTEQSAHERVREEDTPYHAAVKERLWGWQADFIFLWRESLALGMASPAFLQRTVLEVQMETAWCAFVQFSALLSSTYGSWYPLATLCSSTGMACLTVFFWGPMKEVFHAEQEQPHGVVREETGDFEELRRAVRGIPRGDFYARKRIQAMRSMRLVGFYHVLEFLSKGIVTAGLLHTLKPLGTYIAGFLATVFSLQCGWLDLITWPFNNLGLAHYPLTLPTSRLWQNVAHKPAQNCAFLCLLWALLLGLSLRGSWLRQTWAGALEGELTAARAHHMVKLALLAAGLLAQLGLMGLAAALAQLRKAWYEEDAARLQETEEGGVLYSAALLDQEEQGSSAPAGEQARQLLA